MNFTQGDYSSLIKELENLQGKDFTILQSETLIGEFKIIPWSSACWIVKSASRMERIPNNLFGLIRNRIDDEYNRIEKKKEEKTDWKATPGCTTPEEWHLYFGLLAKICQLQNQKKRCEKFAELTQRAIDNNRLLDFLRESDAAFNEKHPEIKTKGFLCESQ
jgi:hypothetical protein